MLGEIANRQIDSFVPMSRLRNPRSKGLVAEGSALRMTKALTRPVYREGPLYLLGFIEGLAHVLGKRLSTNAVSDVGKLVDNSD